MKLIIWPRLNLASPILGPSEIIYVPPDKMQWEEHNIAYAVVLPKNFNLNLYMRKQSDKSNSGIFYEITGLDSSKQSTSFFKKNIGELLLHLKGDKRDVTSNPFHNMYI